MHKQDFQILTCQRLLIISFRLRKDREEKIERMEKENNEIEKEKTDFI